MRPFAAYQLAAAMTVPPGWTILDERGFRWRRMETSEGDAERLEVRFEALDGGHCIRTCTRYGAADWTVWVEVPHPPEAA